MNKKYTRVDKVSKCIRAALSISIEIYIRMVDNEL